MAVGGYFQIMPGYLKNEAATRDTILGDWLHIGFYDQVGYIYSDLNRLGRSRQTRV